MSSHRSSFPWLGWATSADRRWEDSRTLRIGVLLDSLLLPSWTFKVLEEIEHSPIAQIALVIVNRSAPERWNSPRAVWRRRHHFLYEVYSRIDRRLTRRKFDAFERVDASLLLGSCPRLDVAPEQTRYSDRFPDEDLERIASYELDVALRFGFRILRGPVLDIARHGVWSYHHGDNERVRGGPPGFWEVMERQTITGCTLQVLTEQLDAGRVLCRSLMPTDSRSVAHNKNHVYWKSTSLVPRKLWDLYDLGPKALLPQDQPVYRPYSRRLYRKPVNAEFLPLLLRFMLRRLGGRLRRTVLRKQWFLAYRLNRARSVRDDELFRFRHLEPPRDRDWADPFPIRHGSGDWIFFEEYLTARKQAHISVIEIDSNGGASRPYPVLERPYHLSYPFLFRHRGSLFMLPETSQNRTLEVYRCLSFPGEWTLETVLLEGVRAVDATLYEDQGECWMFVNMATEEASHCHDELQLFYASSPLGPWHPHPRNPVSSDARSARPAGALFRYNNDLYRPSQDCSLRYGHGVTLNRVRRLTRDAYEEEAVSQLLPEWRASLRGTHTLNRIDSLTVVDGQRWVRRPILKSPSPFS